MSGSVVLCVCRHSQALDVRRQVGWDLPDPEVQLGADVLGSHDRASVSAGLDLCLGAGHRRHGRLHRRSHQRQDDHHRHDWTRSAVELLWIPRFEAVQLVLFCVVGGGGYMRALHVRHESGPVCPTLGWPAKTARADVRGPSVLPAVPWGIRGGWEGGGRGRVKSFMGAAEDGGGLSQSNLNLLHQQVMLNWNLLKSSNSSHIFILILLVLTAFLFLHGFDISILFIIHVYCPHAAPVTQ